VSAYIVLRRIFLVITVHNFVHNFASNTVYRQRSPDVPRSCLDHHLNGYNETGIYTVFTEVVTNAIRDIYCYMPAAPWTVCFSLLFLN